MRATARPGPRRGTAPNPTANPARPNVHASVGFALAHAKGPYNAIRTDPETFPGDCLPPLSGSWIRRLAARGAWGTCCLGRALILASAVYSGVYWPKQCNQLSLPVCHCWAMRGRISATGNKNILLPQCRPILEDRHVGPNFLPHAQFSDVQPYCVTRTRNCSCHRFKRALRQLRHDQVEMRSSS